MKTNIVPLTGAFMAASILGFFISSIMIYDRWPSWGFAFAILFTIMFIASVISMTKAPLQEIPHEVYKKK